MAIETVDRPASMIPGVDPFDLVDPARYARNGYPHAVWTRLRAEAPVAHFAPPGYRPFWAITKHADIVEIATQPLRFSSAHGIILGRAGAVAVPSEMVVMLDPPRHGPMRRVASRRFTPRALQAQRADIERIAVEILDRAATAGAAGECDFVERIAAPFPLAVIAWILGVPRDDWGLLFRWTNEVIGKDDPEYRRPGETPGQTIRRARGELHAYFERLIEQRRSDPQDDLVSELIRARDRRRAAHRGAAPRRTASSWSRRATRPRATRSAGGCSPSASTAASGRSCAAAPSCCPTPSRRSCAGSARSPTSRAPRPRTARCAGRRSARASRWRCSSASANRDEEVFADPFAFRVDRRPNPHLAFGFGEHFCMGAHVARVELETIFRHLLARLESFEVSGPVERLSSAVNGGIKHLPLRYRLA